MANKKDISNLIKDSFDSQKAKAPDGAWSDISKKLNVIIVLFISYKSKKCLPAASVLNLIVEMSIHR